MITTQTLNKYCMQSSCDDMDFLSRWLLGRLTPEELASMRNREDYEDMLEEMHNNGNSTLTTEKEESLQEEEESKEGNSISKDSFVTFVAVPAIIGATGWLVIKSLSQFL